MLAFRMKEFKVVLLFFEMMTIINFNIFFFVENHSKITF